LFSALKRKFLAQTSAEISPPQTKNPGFVPARGYTFEVFKVTAPALMSSTRDEITVKLVFNHLFSKSINTKVHKYFLQREFKFSTPYLIYSTVANN